MVKCIAFADDGTGLGKKVNDLLANAGPDLGQKLKELAQEYQGKSSKVKTSWHFRKKSIWWIVFLIVGDGSDLAEKLQELAKTPKSKIDWNGGNGLIPAQMCLVAALLALWRLWMS